MHAEFIDMLSKNTQNQSLLNNYSYPLPLCAGFQFFEASAKDNINVKQVFDKLVDVICEKMKEAVNGDVTPSANHKGAGLRDTTHSSQSGCAC